MGGFPGSRGGLEQLLDGSCGAAGSGGPEDSRTYYVAGDMA